MKDKQPEIADYDEFNYDYTHYWDTRDYENQAEIYALEKLLKNTNGSWFIDIGGSFGRHLNQYCDKFEKSIITDYSLIALKQAQSTIKEKGLNNIYLVASNVYNLPFKSDTFDGGMMIRVLHHLENPELAIKEIYRCFKAKSTFILEFANKMHIKNRVKFLVKPNCSIPGYGNNQEFLKLPQSENPEGTKKEAQGIMLNFHPKYIRTLLNSTNIKSQYSQAISFLRIPQIKNLLPSNIINNLEKLLQALIPHTKITPSILLKNEIIKEENIQKLQDSSDIKNILICPKCKGNLNFGKSSISCSECGEKYPIHNNIYDLRYPKPNYEAK